MYDVYKIRDQFPMIKNNIKMQGKPLVFLDNCSTTFKPYSVIEAMNKYYYEQTSNSHRGDYDLCYLMDVEVDEARKTIANFMNADKGEVVFTSGDTMSLNLIAFGYGLKFLKKDDEIILSVAEHASNVLPWFKVAELTGATIKMIPLDDDGRITLANFKKTITTKTKIVSLAHIGNVLGYEIDAKEFAKIAHEYGSIIVLDGAQSVPHIKTDFKDLDVDFLTFSAHKMCGPTGIGALVGKYELLDKMDTYFAGGGNNVTFFENGCAEYLPPPAKFEAGTLNLAGIMGFKAAIEFLSSIGLDNIHQHELELHDYLMSKLEGHDDIIIYNKKARGSILCFNRKDVFSQDEATLLNSKGIAIRSGEHCAKMLKVFLGIHSTCRMSTYLYTSKEDIDIFVDALLFGGDILDAYFSN